MTFFPSSPAARRRAGAALGLLGMLLLTGCESTPAEQPGTPAAEPGTSSGGVGQQVPEPAGNQLSHEEMREQLEARYPDAALSDTTDYWAGLRDVETELQRLVVDPPECKQFVVRSAVPVPAGALVAFADGTAPAAEDQQSEEQGEEDQSEDQSEQQGEEDQSEEQGGSEGEPEAGANQPGGDSSGMRIQLASTEEDDSAEAESAEDESEDGGSENGDSESSDPENADPENGDSENGDSEGSDPEDADSEGGGSDDEEESEPVTVDLPEQRQALILSFRDWRAADAHLAAEQDGLESCDSYTASRGEEDSVETSTSVDPVEVSSDAEAALGTTTRISSEGEREDSAAITLRGGSHIVTVTVPLSEGLSEDEAEVAVEELEAEAVELLESLD
ncbi:hypothetical protein I2485_07850 [Nesterenkonia sp. E16_7]|uniref:hypothetical protein n=1 Tax=unclassified Nesterenkonia TaxID=2629769 RepID=UPI001A917687|nr:MULTISPECIES: hypothetical protein [unclassified Nesterenkonia]MBO0595629.1 hypothetical protein [Nesterenkonia sp. E16_10]MBO0598564.1 hypothetical protein [Nesterenkonia sp. E16_7]